MTKKGEERKRILVRSLKIGVGSAVSIWIATLLQLDFAMSAGIVTLLSVVSTKWDTLKLLGARIVSFWLSVLVIYLLFQTIHSPWIAYALYIFILVLCSNLVDWGSTVSVNAVIGTHFMTKMDFSYHFIFNEFIMMFLGAAVAMLLNLWQGNRSLRRRLDDDVIYIEGCLQRIFSEMAGYLLHERIPKNVWQDIIDLEHHLERAIADAFMYRGNAFSLHADYYVHYIEMRIRQSGLLHNLHYEVKAIRESKEEADRLADCLLAIREQITRYEEVERNIGLVSDMLAEARRERLPVTGEELDNRIRYYHILKDLEDFVIYKKRFLAMLTPIHKEIYWKHRYD
ncbi:MAG: aromatic acid exporter family protein [Lachnospiraceae bacterium]|nr:aromatic acid exporter family protein [Lachnospiraceae bacterium]